MSIFLWGCRGVGWADCKLGHVRSGAFLALRWNIWRHAMAKDKQILTASFAVPRHDIVNQLAKDMDQRVVIATR